MKSVEHLIELLPPSIVERFDQMEVANIYELTKHLQEIIQHIKGYNTGSIYTNEFVAYYVLTLVLKQKSTIPADSSIRSQLLLYLSLIPSIKWTEIPFVLIVNELDHFLISSLAYGTKLLKEGALDFITTHSEDYCYAPHLKYDLQCFKFTGEDIIAEIYSETKIDYELAESWRADLYEFLDKSSNKDNVWKYEEFTIWIP